MRLHFLFAFIFYFFFFNFYLFGSTQMCPKFTSAEPFLASLFVPRLCIYVWLCVSFAICLAVKGLHQYTATQKNEDLVLNTLSTPPAPGASLVLCVSLINIYIFFCFIFVFSCFSLILLSALQSKSLPSVRVALCCCKPRGCCCCWCRSVCWVIT